MAGRVQQLFDDANSYRLIAWLEELAGRVDQAVAWTLKARDKEPGNPDHIEKLAELYAIIGDFETALKLQPNPGLGLLFYMRRYPELIDQAEFAMIEMPEDMDVRYMLAYAYGATGRFESALHVYTTTGVAEAMLERKVRTAGELLAFRGLLSALYGSGNVGLARELAQFAYEMPWTRTVDWMNNSMAACELAILGRHEEALEFFERIKSSPRLPWDPILRDAVCVQEYQDNPSYLETLQAIEDRKADLRKRLPATLAEFGVSL